MGWDRKDLGLPWGLLAHVGRRPQDKPVLCGRPPCELIQDMRDLEGEREGSLLSHEGLSYFCLSLNLQRGARCAFDEVFPRTLWEPCSNYLTFASRRETHLESEVSSQEEESCSRHRLDSHLSVLRGKTTSFFSPSLECIARSFFRALSWATLQPLPH